MEKVRDEVEGLIEEILDAEAESGNRDPMASRFVNILSKIQEDQQARVVQEQREVLKKRLCAMLDGSPELKVEEATLTQLESMVARGNGYRGTLHVDQLIAGRHVLEEFVGNAEEARELVGMDEAPQAVAMPRDAWEAARIMAQQPPRPGARLDARAAERARMDAMREMLAQQPRGVMFNNPIARG